jgi:hypothetical protein
VIELAVAIIGILKQQAPDGATQREQRFMIQAQDPQDAASQINLCMAETLKTKAFICPKNPRESTQGLRGFNNMRVYSTDLFSYFEFDVKQISAATPIPQPERQAVTLQ